MGSLVVRCYLEKYDQQVQGVILSGSPSCNPLAGFGIFIASLFSKIKGDHYRPYLLQLLKVFKMVLRILITVGFVVI